MNISRMGNQLKVEPEVLSTICSESTAKQLHKALRGVVENGTGKNSFHGCKVEVAGKTGTARVVIPTNGLISIAREGKSTKAHLWGFPTNPAILLLQWFTRAYKQKLLRWHLGRPCRKRDCRQYLCFIARMERTDESFRDNFPNIRISQPHRQ